MHFEKKEADNSAEIRATCLASQCSKECNGASGNAVLTVTLRTNS